MHSILNMKCRACDVLNKIPTGKIHPRKNEKSVLPDIKSKMASNVHRSSSKKMLSNFVKSRFHFNFLLFFANSISRDAALPSLTVG